MRRLGQGARDRLGAGAIGLREPQAVRVRARVDLAFRTIADPDGELIQIPDLPCSGVDWLRNKPAVADTSTVTLVGGALPFDPRVIADKSAFASVWLYDEGQREPVRVGGPGHFFGVVDDLKGGRASLTLSCRDMTAVPLQAFLSEGFIQSFAIGPRQSLASVVEDLVRQIPGTHRWAVEVLADAAYDDAVPVVRPAKKGKGGKGGGKQAKGARLSDILPPERVSVWEAVTAVSARAGVVPEIGMTEAGPVVRLVGASDLYRSDVLRPFDRGGRTHRVFMEGDGIADLTWSLDLQGGDERPDFVEVGTVDAAGRKVSGRWPPAPQAAREQERGSFQFIAGAAEDELVTLARAGFEALAANQFRAELVCAEPWSAGGGPHDPDLLDVGYGAVCEVQMTRADERTLLQQLGDKGVSPGLASRIAAAQARLSAMSMAFQAAEVRLSWGASSPFRCSIGLRQFLGTDTLPMFESRPGGQGPIGAGAGVAL